MELLKQTGCANWTDEAGIQIPANRITKVEKLKENKAFTLAKEATKITKSLSDFKELIRGIFAEVEAAERAEAKVEKKPGKGNFTWYNFDRTIKVECNINERIDFDQTQIGFCKELLDQYIDENIGAEGEAVLIKELVKSAFSNTKGRLDAKKVMSLLNYRSKIKHELYQKAMTHLENSIRRPDSKTYYSVAIREEDGSYKDIQLNFSSI